MTCLKCVHENRTYLCRADVWTHSETSHIQRHQDRSVSIIMERVQCLEERLQFVLSEDIVVVVPGIKIPRMDLELKASHDAEVVAGSLHAPPEVWVLMLVDTNGRAIRENDVHVDQVVAHEAVETLVTAVTAAKRRTHQADTGTGAGS